MTSPGERVEPETAKTSDKKPSDTKFVQIATSVQGSQILLYALDESGDVWRFDDKTHQWVMLPRDHGPNQCIEYYLLREVTELVIWVRFSPERLPTRVESYSDLGGKRTSSPIRMTGATSVQHVLHRVGPGVVGIRWIW